MRIELKDISPVRKSLEVEADPEAVRRETDHVLRHYAKKVKVPGFRPGKAPRKVLESRYGKEVREEVRDRLLARLYREAMEEKGLQPLGEPRLEEVSDEEGQPFRFKATVEVLPEFEVQKYRDVEVRKPAVQVGEAEIDNALEEVRQSHAKLVTAEGRTAETGDFLMVDIKGDPEGGEPFHREKMMIEVGSTENLPEFNEGLLGAKAGSTLEFSVAYPKEYPGEELAGKLVRYEVQVHDVKLREVPELDDEFAKDLGDFDDLAALRGKVAENLQRRAEAEAEHKLRQSVLDKVLLENPIPLPDVLVEEEVRHRLEDMIRSLMMQGVDPKSMKLDWKEMRDKQEEPARKTVHARLVLDAVARAEKIEVDNAEIDERIRVEAQRMGEKLDIVRAKIKKGGGVEALKTQLVREKSLDLLTSVANIQNEES